MTSVPVTTRPPMERTGDAQPPTAAAAAAATATAEEDESGWSIRPLKERSSCCSSGQTRPRFPKRASSSPRCDVLSESSPSVIFRIVLAFVLTLGPEPRLAPAAAAKGATSEARRGKRRTISIGTADNGKPTSRGRIQVYSGLRSVCTQRRS